MRRTTSRRRRRSTSESASPTLDHDASTRDRLVVEGDDTWNGRVAITEGIVIGTHEEWSLAPDRLSAIARWLDRDHVRPAAPSPECLLPQVERKRKLRREGKVQRIGYPVVAGKVLL